MPLDIFFDGLFIKPNGRNKIPDTPDAVFFKIHFSDEFELLSDSDAGIAFQSFDGI